MRADCRSIDPEDKGSGEKQVGAVVVVVLVVADVSAVLIDEEDWEEVDGRFALESAAGGDTGTVGA